MTYPSEWLILKRLRIPVVSINMELWENSSTGGGNAKLYSSGELLDSLLES